MKRILVALCVILLAAPYAANAQDVLRNLSAEDVETILEDDGYSAVEILSETSLSVRVNGDHYLLTIFDDGDLQLYFALSGTDADVDDLNEWNRTKRLSRAYIDEEGDPVVESDILADQGITKAQFLNFVNVFKLTTQTFRTFVSDL